MVCDETDRTGGSPFVGTVAAIWIAGSLAGVLTAAVSTTAAGWEPSRVEFEAVRLAVAAAFGGLVLHGLLPLLAGSAISYGGAAAALGVGGAVGSALRLVWAQEAAGRLTGAGAISLLAGGGPVGLLSSFVALGVTYQVVGALVRTSGARGIATLGADSPPSAASFPVVGSLKTGAGGWLETAVAHAGDAVAFACSDIGDAPAAEVPGRVLAALAELATCTSTLRRGEVRGRRAREAVAQLVDGLERFQTALTELATPAVDGARLRHELEHADGLAQIRAALERLAALAAQGAV